MNDTLDYPISISKPPAASETLALPVDTQKMALAADACAVVGFKNLEAKFRFKRWRKHGVSIFCDFKAQIKQECIATLEPVSSRVNQSFERQFLPERSSDYKMPEIIDGEMVLDPEASDFPDIIEGDAINLWDVLIEELILVINPFPRADQLEDDIELEQDVIEELIEPTHRPFSELKALITEKKSNK